MYCRHCGKEISEDTVSCPACGARQFGETSSSSSSYEDPFSTTTSTEIKEKPAKCWYVFALIGKILGIVAVSLCWIPYPISMFLGIPGIVMSCLGRKAVGDGAEKNSRVGLILSIVGTAVSLFIFILFLILGGIVGGMAAAGLFEELMKMFQSLALAI